MQHSVAQDVLQDIDPFVADPREAHVEPFELLNDGRHHEAANALVGDRVVVEIKFAEVAEVGRVEEAIEAMKN